MVKRKSNNRNHMRKTRNRKKHIVSLSRRYKASIMREVFSLSSKDIDNFAIHINPLKMGDKLFNESSNPNDPRIMPNALDNDVHFEYGYLNSTIFLLNVIEFGKSYFHKDSYIYPALFCFRQYLENIIKTIVMMYAPDTKFTPQHNLVDFWKELRNYIDCDELEQCVEQIIQEFQNVDKKATAFRYPGALNNAFYKNDGSQEVYSMLLDVKKLKDRILQIYSYFDGLYENVCRLKN